MTVAEDTDARPITKPTDKSIPPLMMTNVSPVARRRMAVDAIRILLKFLILKKFGSSRLKNKMRIIRNNRTQFLKRIYKMFCEVFI